MKRHNKQHHPRAASFKRIAKGLRADARDYKKADVLSIYADILSLIAERIDAEADLLRSMR